MVNFAYAQHEPHHKDTTEYHSIKDALKSGTLKLHGRNFFMTTLNQGGLTDYYANGAGAGMHYRSGSWKGFHLEFGGFFIFNLFSSDLSKQDRLSNQYNRYELELFDIENPKNREDLDRLEELSLSYEHKWLFINAGRLELNTPYINPQDGRMRPTVEEGIWFEMKPTKKLQFNAGFLNDISPRSTVKFYTIGNSIGVYAQGVQTNGEKADYAEHQHTKGIGLAQVFYKPNEKLTMQVFNLYVDNIFNTSLIQADYIPENDISPVFGLQYHIQHRLNQGGNQNQEHAYYQNQKKAQVVSTRAGLKVKKHLITANYTHITDDGRFLMPREWGRDAFYTFMPRERNEGFGNVHAFSMQYVSNWQNKKLATGLGYGYYNLPDVTNYRLNKYGMPSYHQINADIRYNFGGNLEGLQAQLLVAAKLNAGKTYGQYNYIFNKVNMANFNFVLNYTIHTTKNNH